MYAAVIIIPKLDEYKGFVSQCRATTAWVSLATRCRPVQVRTSPKPFQCREQTGSVCVYDGKASRVTAHAKQQWVRRCEKQAGHSNRQWDEIDEALTRWSNLAIPTHCQRRSDEYPWSMLVPVTTARTNVSPLACGMRDTARPT